jgi:hypothetical protein
MRILNFFNFILESSVRIEVPLRFSNEFDYVLREIDSPISDALRDLSGSPSDISLINIGDDNDSATFTTSIKLSQHFNTQDSRELKLLISPLRNSSSEIYHKNRTSIKIGRLLKKLLGSKYSDVEIEKFVNQYKSSLDDKILSFDTWSDYQIVSGYSSKFYTYSGSSSNPLMNSCMNDQYTLVEFYNYVPVKLLVLSNNEGHVFGRALIWKTDKGYFMDRIYTAFDSDYYKFINFAKDHDMIYKAVNKSGPKIEYVKNGVTGWFPMKINLKFNIMEYDADQFTGSPKNIPYMDTFIYGQDNYLSNYEPTEGKFVVLQDTEGEPLVVTPHYDIYGVRIEDMDDYVFSKTQDGWIHNRDAKWLDSEKDYFSFDYLDNPDNGFSWSKEAGTYIKNKD